MKRYLLCIAALLTACHVRQFAVEEVAPTLARGTRALESEPDLAVATASIPAILKQTEALLESAPRDRTLLLTASQGWLEYAFGPLTDQLEALPPSARQERQVLIGRITELYDRSFLYAGRALGTVDGRFPAALGEGPVELEKMVAKLDPQAARALLFAGMSMAAAVDLNRGDLSRLVDLPKAIVLLERAYALSPGEFHAGAAMTLGLIYASPAMAPTAGHDTRATSKLWFDRALALTKGRYLLIPVMMARTYAVAVGDRALFEATDKRVLRTPLNAVPELRLSNLLAMRRAQRDLQRADTYFANRPAKSRYRRGRAARRRAGW